MISNACSWQYCIYITCVISSICQLAKSLRDVQLVTTHTVSNRLFFFKNAQISDAKEVIPLQ